MQAVLLRKQLAGPPTHRIHSSATSNAPTAFVPFRYLRVQSGVRLHQYIQWKSEWKRAVSVTHWSTVCSDHAREVVRKRRLDLQKQRREQQRTPSQMVGAVHCRIVIPVLLLFLFLRARCVLLMRCGPCCCYLCQRAFKTHRDPTGPRSRYSHSF
jgi:hypothetical protein